MEKGEKGSGGEWGWGLDGAEGIYAERLGNIGTQHRIPERKMKSCRPGKKTKEFYDGWLATYP